MKRMTYIFLLAVLWLTLTPVQAQGASLSVSAYRLEEQSRLGVESAVFTLYGADGAALGFTQQCGVWRCGGAVTALPTDSDGRLVLCGLPSGEYQLVQNDAPQLYRRLKAPVKLSLDDGGALRVEGRACQEVAILHRSGSAMVTAAVLGLCSVLPAVVRLILLWGKKRL